MKVAVLSVRKMNAMHEKNIISNSLICILRKKNGYKLKFILRQ